MAKAIANRLKSILPKSISENQSAFVGGRLIADNILTAHEVIHFIKMERAKNKGHVGIKLDMSKAYDKVKWGFLQVVMDKMGFDPRWSKLVMKCISSVSFSFLINGRAYLKGAYAKVTPSLHTSFFLCGRTIILT